MHKCLSVGPSTDSSVTTFKCLKFSSTISALVPNLPFSSQISQRRFKKDLGKGKIEYEKVWVDCDFKTMQNELLKLILKCTSTRALIPTLKHS